MKALFVILYAALAIGCQEAEAADFTAEEVITEYMKNGYRASKFFEERTSVKMTFTSMQEQGNEVAIVGFYYDIDAWFGCVAPPHSVPVEWVNLNAGDTVTVSGYHAAHQWKKGTLGVLFQQCEPHYPI
tara:strand:+ start:733 stop:1119 length:387 start_codon:yes stop_codon:yes gene_type:complete